VEGIHNTLSKLSTYAENPSVHGYVKRANEFVTPFISPTEYAIKEGLGQQAHNTYKMVKNVGDISPVKELMRTYGKGLEDAYSLTGNVGKLGAEIYGTGLAVNKLTRSHTTPDGWRHATSVHNFNARNATGLDELGGSSRKRRRTRKHRHPRRNRTRNHRTRRRY